ncbi:30S ribosomal protein S16 [Candidatus Margulisiibacteriota bacterium]
MALRIRLRRGGRKKSPFYSIAVMDSTTAAQGYQIDKLGFYQPGKNGIFSISKEKMENWLSRGAVPTDRIVKILEKEGITNKYTDRLHTVIEKRTKVLEVNNKKQAEEEKKKKVEEEKSQQEGAQAPKETKPGGEKTMQEQEPGAPAPEAPAQEPAPAPAPEQPEAPKEPGA